MESDRPKKSANRNIVYACTQCGAEVGRENLCAKQVVFLTLGERGRRLRTRTVAWLCVPCREEDPAWNKRRFDTPGFADVQHATE